MLRDSLRIHQHLVSGWSVALREEFKELKNEHISEETTEHHHHIEEGVFTQKTFHEEALCFTGTFNDKGNSIPHDSPELLELHGHTNIINEFVVPTVEAFGRDQCNDYHKSVIVEHACSVHDPIKEYT